jgi:hypothetical protein
MAFALVMLLGAVWAQGGGPEVPIPQLRLWEENMKKFGLQHADERSKGVDESAVWYYDGERVFYQIADYTSDPQWNTFAQNSKETYRNYVFQNNGRVGGWRVFPHGLFMDYTRTGDEESKRAALLLAKGSPFAMTGGGVPEALSRETAYIIDAYLVAEALGEPRSANLEKAVGYALGHIDQWFVKNSSRNWAPFMFGLTAEALIAYHDQAPAGDFGRGAGVSGTLEVGLPRRAAAPQERRSLPDPRILPAIKLGCDECWKRAWREKEQAFFYRADNPAQGTADLNLLVAPAYAWVYLQTGDITYRDRGDKAFAGGVRGAYFAGGKQFSQNYRWSFDYAKWRTEAEHRRVAAGEPKSGKPSENPEAPSR